MKKGIGKKVLAAAMCLLVAFQALPFVAEGKEPNWKTDSDVKTIDLKDELPSSLVPTDDAFDSAELKYKVVNADKTLYLRYDFALDDTHTGGYAADFLDKYPDAKDSDFEVADDTDLPPIGFEFTLSVDDKIFENVSSAIKTGVELKTESGTKIGTYSVTYDGTAQTLTVTGTLSKVVYNKQEVTGGLDLALQIKMEDDGTADPEITVEGGEIKVSVTMDNPAPEYSLEKTASKFTGDYATYTIKATAKHATLAGATITDTIPTGLKIEEVKLGDTTLIKDAATKGYTLTAGVLEYTFPDESTARDATLTVKVQLDPSTMTPEDYAKYLKGEALSFENTAALSGGDVPEEIESKATATFPKSTTDNPNSFMTKDGKRTALNSPYYDWTITAQTYFSGSDKIYLIDSVDDIEHTHMYKLNGSNNVDFTVNGTGIEAIPVTGNKTYSQLQDSGLAEDYFSTLVGSHEAVYYTVQNGSKKQAVMIIPFTASDLSSPVTIKYQTEAKLSADGTLQEKLNNSATLIWWNGTGGTGTGSWDHSASINKTADADYTLIKKASAGYDESKHQQTWKFTVNQAGQPLNNVSITDELGTYGQKFVSLTYRKGALGSDGKVSFSGSPIAIVAKSETSSEKPYYEMGANELLTISLPDITDKEVYELNLVTEVVDPAILAKQGSSGLENEATLNYNGNTKDTGEIKTNIHNTLIQKAAVGTYDFTNHGFTWTVTVNPNHVPITNGMVTDTLPVGATFGTLTGAQRINADGTTKSDLDSVTGDTIKFKDNSTIMYSVDDTAAKNWAAPTEGAITPPARGTTTFTLPAASTDSYIFTFTTLYPDAYRDNFFTFTGAASLTVRNDVKLDGKVKGTDIDASAYAENTVSAPPVTKSGTFPDGKQWVDWTIVLNKDQIDLSNATVEDTLKEWFALDEGSFSISSTTIAANGTTGAETAIPAEQLNKFNIATSLTGFKFNIPSDYKITPLVVKFKTYFLENTEHAAMTNEVSLKWGKSNEAGSGPKTPGGTASFDMDSYATAKNIRLLQITKTDTAGVPLVGAEFTLTPFEWDDIKGEWVLSATKAVAKATTNKGLATFLFLKEGTPYRLEETKAPDSSYLRDETVRYFVFGAAPDGKPIPAKWGAQTVPLTTYNYSLSFENVKTSETGTITGKKTTANGVTGLAGATIGLYRSGEQYPFQTAVSGADGSFTFQAAPGTYEIKEVNAPSGYYLNGKTISVTIANAGDTVTTDTGVPPVPILITNTRIPSNPGNPGGGGGNPGGGTGKGYIVIQKSVEGDDALSGFTFEITDGKTYTERFVTDENGRIETGDLPAGTYTVREISAAGVTDKYVLPEAQTVHISGFGTKLSFVNKLRPEFIPDDGVPQGGVKPTEPIDTIPDNDVPKGTVETFGPKTGYTGASPLWALMLGLSLAGLGYSVISLLVARKKGRHVDK